MIRIFGTVFVGLLGLAFGSFLNVCLSRWPEGESVVKPRSHCRACGRSLAWWENVPLASWLLLRGCCRTCGTQISWRYPLVEAAVGILWASTVWNMFPANVPGTVSFSPAFLLERFSTAVLCWLLIGLATLDAEHFWLPDFLTLPGIVLGLFFSALIEAAKFHHTAPLMRTLLWSSIAAASGAAFIVALRWLYWLVRRKEGVGLGDAKLMAMLGAWLGFSGMLVALVFGIVLGAMFAIALLIAPKKEHNTNWAMSRLPLGTFLCIGGVVSSLWGQHITMAYMRWAGF